MFYGAPQRFQRDTKVIAPPAEADLVTLAVVKEELGIVGSGSDTILSRYISACSAAAQAYCGCVFGAQTVEDTFRSVADATVGLLSSAADVLVLSDTPVASISALTEDGASLTDADYVVDAASGSLRRLDSAGMLARWGGQIIVVRYGAGYPAIPADVADAIVEWIKFRFFARGRDPGLKSEKVDGVYEASFLWGTGPGGPGDMPVAVAAVLDRYHIPVMA